MDKAVRRHAIREWGIFAAFLALMAALAVVSGGNSISPRNLVLVVKQASINGILAMGMMFVIISGGIDLSVGSILAVSGVAAAMFAHPGEYHLAVPILAAMGVGLAMGVMNGVIVAFGGLPPFIATLGMLTMGRGLALILSRGVPIYDISRPFENLAGGFFPSADFPYRVPILAVYFAAAVAAGAFILAKTVYGRHVYAVGGNEMSARVSGINVAGVKLSVYAISGLLAGIAGLLLASRIVSGNPNSGSGYELDAIAAVTIGGVSLSGGAGRWHGAMVGTLFIAVMGNGLDLLGMPSNLQLVIKGAIIIAAVFYDIRAKG
ncbi:MAG: ABC transporter permease [Planctomycetota bacterium]|jgi:ribose transport system permease protein/inositol transport system permease protein|nr:ABC transporter permease [Planctomycetota bacterium]